MGIDKIVRKMLSRPKDIDIGEVRKLLDYFGYAEKGNGSECIFHKKGSNPINVPTVKGRGVKEFYIKRLAAHLELEEWLEGQSGK
jgi:hypothetical protein